MANDRVPTPLELRAAEAVIVAEKLALMLQIAHQDAAALSSGALLRAYTAMPSDHWPGAMSTASGLIDLTTKIAAMRLEIAPLLADIIAKEALAARERIGAPAH